MSLTESQWREIVHESIYLPQDGSSRPGRHIALDKLRAIIQRPPKVKRKAP